MIVQELIRCDSLFLVALSALGRALGLFLVASLAQNVEGVLLGTHGTRVGRGGVFAVAIEAVLGIFFLGGGVMTYRTIVSL